MTTPARLLVTLAAAFLAADRGLVADHTQAPPLKDSAWVLSALNGRAPLARTTIAMRFDAERVTGSDGCNRFTAAYTSSGNTLQIGPRAASTQMACPDPVAAQAMAFVSAITRTRSYRMEAGQLHLLGDDGGVLAILAPEPTLAGTSWVVTGYNNGKQAVTSVLGGTTVTMAFGADGRVTGTAGCNTYTGPYTVDGAKLTFGPLATTRKMCATPERIMEQEQQFLKAVSAAVSARIEGGRLELRTADGALAVTLVRDAARR